MAKITGVFTSFMILLNAALSYIPIHYVHVYAYKRKKNQENEFFAWKSRQFPQNLSMMMSFMVFGIVPYFIFNFRAVSLSDLLKLI